MLDGLAQSEKEKNVALDLTTLTTMTPKCEEFNVLNLQYPIQCISFSATGNIQK